MRYDINELYDMLRYCRPADSKTEHEFIEKYITPLEVTEDEYGNLYKFVGDSRVMWSCHTDTVHRNDGMQELVFRNGFVYSKDRNCLGADCTTGVWLMTNMIKAEVPGIYIFHREEEIGMRGSGFISKYYDEDLRSLDAAIAFDRHSYKSIITHQMGQRCCSEKFSASLANMLDLDYSSDTGGSFTDTYSYIDQISECTNISVGYFNQHTPHEKQDIIFAETLLQRLFKFDESKLVIARDPTVVDMDEGDWIEKFYRQQSSYYEDEIYDMAELVRHYPEEAAKLLIDNNVTQDDILGTVVTPRKRLG